MLPYASLLQELTPTVKQTLYSSVQNHHMWEDAEFWKNALYQATQAELYRIYSDQEECSDSDGERVTTATERTYYSTYLVCKGGALLSLVRHQNTLISVLPRVCM